MFFPVNKTTKVITFTCAINNQSRREETLYQQTSFLEPVLIQWDCLSVQYDV